MSQVLALWPHLIILKICPHPTDYCQAGSEASQCRFMYNYTVTLGGVWAGSGWGYVQRARANGGRGIPRRWLECLAGARAYRPAEGGERACNSRTASTEGEMLAVTKFRTEI